MVLSENHGNKTGGNLFMKKRIIAMFLAATMAFSLAACGSGNG